MYIIIIPISLLLGTTRASTSPVPPPLCCHGNSCGLRGGELLQGPIDARHVSRPWIRTKGEELGLVPKETSHVSMKATTCSIYTPYSVCTITRATIYIYEGNFCHRFRDRALRKTFDA